LIEKLGIIGVGHLASYLVDGLMLANPEIEIVLSPRNVAKASSLAKKYGLTVASSNQSVADRSDLLLLTTRPQDISIALAEVRLSNRHLVVCTAAVAALEDLRRLAHPANILRAMPLSCAAICKSPTLLFPGNARAQELFEMLGQVHVVNTQQQFMRLSTMGAFYGWIFALLDQTVAWVEQDGVSKDVARQLVLETVRGASELGLATPEKELASLLNELATPGGITHQGLALLEERESFVAWSQALEVILHRLRENKS
jgi:pyrroline-5-carboxylate reductase